MTALLVGALSFPSPLFPNGVDLDAVRADKWAEAVPIEEPIVVDGRLDEVAWQVARPTGDFYQQQPHEGEPATRRSEVRFLHDATTLYVGAMLYDDEPDKLIINDLKRDFGGRDGDLFGLILDTFQDRRNAYGFLTNPGGAQRETQAFDNGRRNDPSWDGVWFVRAAIHENGWSVEIAIPFKTLRFPEREAQEWGMNMVRITRRDNEVTTWSPVPRQFSHYNVVYAGRLSGIRAGQRGRNLRVKPFATARLGRGQPGGGEREADGGVDLKWGLSSSLVLDATYRTDFSQVEADEQQINLTRFSLFFPEKREFFLESPASFQIGIAGGNNEARRDLLPFFSRRIGLSADGQPIPVVGGLRLTGRAGRLGIGLLNMQTEATAERPEDNFTAARATWDLTDATTVGGFYFGRESEGPVAYNRVAGLDLRLTPNRVLEIEALAMRSVTGGASEDWAGRTGFRLDANAHRALFGYFHIGEGFRHDLGYVRRHGVGTAFGQYARIFRPQATYRWVREYSVGADLEVVGDDRYREVLTRTAGLNYEMRFADGGRLEVNYTSTFERLSAPFRIRPGVAIAPADYDFEDISIEFESDQSNRLSGEVEYTTGGFWNGQRTELSGSARFRLNAHLAASASLGRTRVVLPQGTFVTGLAAMRLDWSLTTRMFANAFVQYNGDTRTWLSNVRFNFIHRPLSDIYVVWNETHAPGLKLRSLIVKYTHLIPF